MKKRVIALMLIICLFVSMGSTTIAAGINESEGLVTTDAGVENYALNTKHPIRVVFVVLYVSDQFPIGYSFGDSEDTTFICQYSVAHSDTAYNNHTIALKDIREATERLQLDDGFKFVGWSKQASENPPVNSFSSFGSTACNKGDRIYLVAKEAPVMRTYSLTYDANGGINAPEPQTASTTEKTHTFSVTSDIPTREGYTFMGWSDTPYGEVQYHANSPVTVSSSDPAKTVYAVWEENKKYMVTYTDGVDEMVIFQDQVYSDLTQGTPTPQFQWTRTQNNDPIREGYVFKGWSPEVEETVTKDAIYTATWGKDENGNGVDDETEERYTVTYTDGVDETVVFENQIYSNLLLGMETPQFQSKEDNTNIPVREGYEFKGWTPTFSDVVTGNVTYIAQWELEKKYTVVYTSGIDGEVIFPNQTHEELSFGEDTPDFIGVPMRRGYIFVGWLPSVEETVTEDTIYSAQWVPDKNENGIPDDEETSQNENESPNNQEKPQNENESVQTGDSTNFLVWSGLAGIALISMGGSLQLRRRKN